MFANLKRIQKCGGRKRNRPAYLARLAAAAAIVAGAAPARAQVARAPFALRDGESLTYSVRWGFIPSVGRINISAEQIGSGDDAVCA